MRHESRLCAQITFVIATRSDRKYESREEKYTREPLQGRVRASPLQNNDYGNHRDEPRSRDRLSLAPLISSVGLAEKRARCVL